MKILFFSPYFYPKIGGVERHVFEITRRLAARGNKITILTELPPKNYHTKENIYQSNTNSDTVGGRSEQPVKSSYFESRIANKVSVIFLNFGGADKFKKFRIWKEIYAHLNLIKEADVIHCHDVFFWYIPFKILFPGKKVFVTFHGYESYPVSFKAILIRKFSEVLASGNICVGDFIRKWYKTKPDYVIYGGVEVVGPKTKNVRQSDKSALFYGRLDEQTGILTYAEAVQKINKKYPKFKFEIIGDGKYKDKLKRNIIESFVLNPEKKLFSYRFAFVSRYLSILEALAAGRMVFAVYDNPIKEDYLRMSPFADFISISGNARDLAQEISYYLDNRVLEKEKVAAGIAWARLQTWDKVVNTYEKLWSK